ncbi:hypothetical protein [Staphylococcus gallinarum]|uniref:hypothetical protein n=1 Tax=Staphylococcus gallinarum TaxID=1293 RepID=UPI0030BE8E4B
MYKLTNKNNEVVGLGNFANIKIAILSKLADQIQNLSVELESNTDLKETIAILNIACTVSEIDGLKQYINMFDWSLSYLSNEIDEIVEFLDLATFEDYNSDDLYKAIEEINNKLKNSGFKFSDIKRCFQNFDLNVIEDIYVLLEYIHITDDINGFMENEDTKEFEIIAQNNTYTILIV